MGNLDELATTKLAARAGIDRVTAWRWLTGRARPSRLALARLATLGITLQLPPPRKDDAGPGNEDAETRR